MRCFDSQEYLALIRGGGCSEFTLKMNDGTEAETEHILLQQLIFNRYLCSSHRNTNGHLIKSIGNIKVLVLQSARVPI